MTECQCEWCKARAEAGLPARWHFAPVRLLTEALDCLTKDETPVECNIVRKEIEKAFNG